MKKTVSRVLLVLLLLLFACPTMTSAESQTGATLPYYVSDAAGLLSSDQWQELENAAKQISERYGCGVYLVTLENFLDYGSFDNFWNFSEQFYSNYQLGIGEEKNGILLILSMNDRDYSLLAYGSAAHEAFTDYGKSVLENGFLDNFRRNDWFGGFSDYINGCGELLSRAAEGQPLDVRPEVREEMPDGVSTAIIVGIPLLAGVGTCESMRRRMKPVRRQSRADEYIVPGGINLSLKRDVFLNRTVTRTVVRTENRTQGHGGHGGGTTVNGHGFSGHSGKF